MKVLILAGGFATRLWPLTEKTAKPLIPLAGKPLISWILEKLPLNAEVIISTNAAFAEDFEEWRTEYFPKRSIEIFREDSFGEEGKKGALFATALVLREKNITEDFLLIAGDNYFGFSLEALLTEFAMHPEDPLLAAYDIRDKELAKSFGVVVPLKMDPTSVEIFQEKPDEPLSTLISTGCFVFPKRLIPEIIEYAETHRDDLGKIFEHFLSQKIRVGIFSFAEPWFDIGSFPAYLEANTLLLQGKLQQEKGVSIAEDAELQGSVFLGKGTRLLKQVIVENSVILEGCQLENCTVRNSVIGKNVILSGIDLDHQIIRDESFLVKEI